MSVRPVGALGPVLAAGMLRNELIPSRYPGIPDAVASFRVEIGMAKLMGDSVRVAAERGYGTIGNVAVIHCGFNASEGDVRLSQFSDSSRIAGAGLGSQFRKS
ncbi:hypothetical protein [Sinorhizobium fredii]|nr:hypothetical protein [Sinorhizobium fredii]